MKSSFNFIAIFVILIVRFNFSKCFDQNCSFSKISIKSSNFVTCDHNMTDYEHNEVCIYGKCLCQPN